ncbi:hypothetical protein DL771_006588 [Monosporascus sp. 5C6A]|nr:hypothetical protein DL771_006588 [Monosporascus sp. 5C6A]
MTDSRPRDSSAWTRFGLITILSLLGAMLVIIAGVGFLGFLWYSTTDNDIWHRIILNNWATRAITLTSTALRIAVDIQDGICLSMLAAIALEKSSVPLASVGSVSMMRAGGDKGLVPTMTDFIWPMLRWGPRLDQLVLPTVLLTLAIMTLSQFISAALLSDVTLQLVPGYNETVNINYNFAYNNTIPGYNYTPLSSRSLWEASLPSLWPMFAEYSEPPIMQENVSDTGLSLRAFLPFSAQERPLIRNYSGKALVLDSRVTCQRPVLQDVQRPNNRFLTGRVGPSTPTPRLDNPGIVGFTCPDPGTFWSICELSGSAIVFGDGAQFSGGLVSEFREFPPSLGQNKSGAAILIISPTIFFADFPTQIARNRSEFALTDVQGDQVAISLCYTSFDIADRWMDAYSDTDRTEPTAPWAGNAYSMTTVANQLNTGYTTSLNPRSAENRGIMRFQPSTNWAAPQSEQFFNDGPTVAVPVGDEPGRSLCNGCLPPLTERLHLLDFSHGLRSIPSLGNYTAQLPDTQYFGTSDPIYGVYSDTWLYWLFEHQFTNYSSSVALQAIITSLAGIEYYNQLGQFDKSDNVTIVSFVNAYTPGGPFGQKRATTPWGFGAVIILLISNTMVVAVVTIRFFMQVTVSRIGDGWQAIAQVAYSREEKLPARLQHAINQVAEGDTTEHCLNDKDDGIKVRLGCGSGVIELADN